jgi:hypothetical protein
MDATPFEHEVVAVAEKFTGEPTELPLLGAVMCTPDEVLTVTVTAFVAAPPQ